MSQRKPTAGADDRGEEKGSAMLERNDAKSRLTSDARKCGWVVDGVHPSALRPSEVLGRDMAVDSSTMRLNSWTTSGEILSQRRLRV